MASPTPPPRSLREWFRFSLITLLFLLLVRGLALEAFSIPTSSMENTLLVGDFLLVNKVVYGARIPGTGIRFPPFRDPGRGEIIVFRPPHDRARNYVKRVAGVPGDTLLMKGKVLVRNGRPVREPHALHRHRGGDAVHPDMRWQSDFLAAAGPLHPYAPSRDNWGPLIVPEDSYFVLGDNRDNSEDSRYWGFVPRSDVMGTPWMVYLSFEPGTDSGESLWSRIRWQRVGRRIQ